MTCCKPGLQRRLRQREDRIHDARHTDQGVHEWAPGAFAKLQKSRSWAAVQKKSHLSTQKKLVVARCLDDLDHRRQDQGLGVSNRCTIA